MSDLRAQIAASAEARRKSIRLIVAEFRKHPAHIDSMFEEVALELQGARDPAEPASTAIPHPAPKSPPARKPLEMAGQGDATPVAVNRGKKKMPGSEGAAPYNEQALSLLAEHPDGVSQAQLALKLYGAEDANGNVKARAVIHELRSKGHRIETTASGLYRLQAHEPAGETGAGGSGAAFGVALPAPPDIVREILAKAQRPMMTREIYEAALKIDPNVNKGNLESAVSKMRRRGELIQHGHNRKRLTYEVNPRFGT